MHEVIEGKIVITIDYFKQKYAERWSESNLCESIAALFLMLNLNLKEEDIVPTGKGTLSSELIDDPLESPPDFFVKKYNIWFEVTSSDLTKQESMQRCMRHGLPGPHLFIREGKIEFLKMNRILSRTFFISVNWSDGSVLFFPAKLVKNYNLVNWYEYGGREYYYAIPWREWLTPKELKKWLT